MTTIEWTDKVWNPVLGCSRVSAGCEHCYAERVAHRGMAEEHRGLTVLGRKGPRWTGEVRFLPERLREPLRWRKPRMVFVNSMSDLFHEGVSNEQIAAIFGVMAACPQHTFQILTKRPERMLEWFKWLDDQLAFHRSHNDARWLRDPRRPDHDLAVHYVMEWFGRSVTDLRFQENVSAAWPLPNVWLGVSVEDQATADERIPLLLQTPAAVRWVSYEPALGPVDFDPFVDRGYESCGPQGWVELPSLDWIVVGGESGPGARPFDLAWARSTIAQCRGAAVPVFVKQLGARPVGDLLNSYGQPIHGALGLRDRKGGDMAEWPEDIRRREWPEVTR